MDDLAAMLAEAEERFRLAFDRAPHGMVLVAPDGRFIRVNDAMCDLLGYSRGLLLSVTFQEVTHPDDLDEDLELVRAVLHDEIDRYTMEKRYQHADGHWVLTQIDVALARADDGTPRYFVTQVQDITEARAAAERLAALQRDQRATLDALEQGILLTDLHGHVLLENPAAERLLGCSASELAELFADGSFAGHLGDAGSSDASATALQRDARRGERISEVPIRWRRPDGREVTFRLSTEPRYDDDGVVTGVVSAFVDITEQQAAEAARAAAEAEVRTERARFEALIEHSADGICVADRAGALTYASPAGRVLLGQGPDHVGRSFFERAHPEELDEMRTVFSDLLVDPGGTRTGTVRFAKLGGGWRHVEIIATNRLGDPAVRGLVANVRDVTERAEAAAQLAWQAFHDPLTGLPNRLLLMDRLEHAIARARRLDERTALLFIDLDRFKLVNDTLGHEAGDQVLVEVGRRIVQAVRAGDTVSRHGGDEFMVVAESAEGPAAVVETAERIRSAIEQPVQLPNGTVNVSTSIGIAFDAGQDPALLLRDADTALYRAKDRGKNRYEIFKGALRAAALRRIEAEQVLRHAHEADTLVVFHQPIVDLESGRIIGTEALLRVPGPRGSLQAPGPFIEVADDSGLIVPIGARVLELACATLAGWRSTAAADAPSHVAVNVSPRQLTAPGFVDLVHGVLADHGLHPDDLVLEFTEEAIIGADRVTTSTVQELHDLGVELAIDDFGTGYSSLSYLKRFPIDWVKLDRSFVSGLGVDPSDTEIVKAVVGLGRSLGLNVVAEGIERPHQLAALRELGCPSGQGYLLARPSAPEHLSLADFAISELAAR